MRIGKGQKLLGGVFSYQNELYKRKKQAPFPPFIQKFVEIFLIEVNFGTSRQKGKKQG